MGMFDTVIVPCPKCGKKEGFQTKSGDCVLRVYELNDTPPDVLIDINRHSPYTCRECGTNFEVDKVNLKPIEVVELDEKEKYLDN